MTGVVDPVALIAVLAVLAPGTVLAQTTALSPSNPEKSWNLDFSGSAGIAQASAPLPRDWVSQERSRSHARPSLTSSRTVAGVSR
jgi:hypothetical protein